MPRRRDIESILIIGSGPIVIGQACEFDYSGTQACRVLHRRECGAACRGRIAEARIGLRKVDARLRGFRSRSIAETL